MNNLISEYGEVLVTSIAAILFFVLMVIFSDKISELNLINYNFLIGTMF